MPQQVAEPQTSSGAKEDTGRPRAALEIYAVWTALIVIAALAVTFLLGQQPRVQAANALLPDGWVVATDRQRTFIVFLPEQWEQLDAAADDEQQQLHQLFGEREAYRRATEPLTGFVQDAEPLFLARGSDAPAASAGAFLIVMRSRLLNRLTETEAMGLAQEGDVAISDARHVTDFGRSYVGLRVVVHLSDTEEMICRQQFTTGAHEALLLALCTAPGQLSPSAIDTILGSTQRLAP
ncbi:MAG TPA: hypothetical protein VK879_12080 [Candidatus Sulfomarinibacteraceae bacterium]|nr:hypothetical protein [Candidatus Sulfomarinibacteraceae bacterium]